MVTRYATTHKDITMVSDLNRCVDVKDNCDVQTVSSLHQPTHTHAHTLDVFITKNTNPGICDHMGKLTPVTFPANIAKRKPKASIE